MKHLYKLSLLLLALLLPAIAAAHDIEVDGIYYNINGNEATVTYKGSNYYFQAYSGSVSIPSKVTYNGTTYSVTAIGDNAFYSCSSLTSVTIPNSVTSIGETGFAGCSSLFSIDIPNSVTSIGYSPFSACSGLTSITVAGDNPKYDSRGYCNAIIETASNTLIAGCQNTVIPNSVISIGGSAFFGCSGLTSITIPNSVVSIGSSAFRGCSVTNITIPTSVTFIGNSAFCYCSALTSITIPNSVITIGNAAFKDCASLSSITIPNSVSKISDRMFHGCSSLTSIDIPNSITSIGYEAFSGCSDLTSVTIPNTVTSIYFRAFQDCNSLSSITIGNSVTTIGDWAFYGCLGLTEIYCLALTPPTIESDTFYGRYSATLFVPKEAVNAYKAADNWKDFNCITAIVSLIPGSTFVVDGIYYQVINANAVSVIANAEVEAFYTGDVIIPASVKFEEDTFAVTGIENNAFDGCFELTSITIPNSVEAIGEQAFQGCTGLTSVTIGSGVTAIGAKAFNYCNALETVKCLGTVPPVMASADCFTNTAYNRATLLVPRQFVDVYQTADFWYKFAHIEGWGSAGRGDIDGDGEVSIRDVTTLIDAILNGNNEGVYFESADVNINGRLDIGDVTTIVDMLLNDIE